MKNKLISKLMWRFDRTFGNSKNWFSQLVWVLSILFVAICICIPLGDWLTHLSLDNGSADGGFNVIWYTVGVILKSNSLDWNSPLPHGWQMFLVFIGTFLFSGITLTYVGNLLRNRLEAYKNGSVRYCFENHLLFFGGSEVILPMIKELAKNRDCRRRHFVVLSDEETKTIRLRIQNSLSEKERKVLKITILRGVRDEKDSLKSVCVQKAARVYIVGDNPFNPDHDSKNMACWNLTKELCAQRKDVPCFLMFSQSSSTYLFKQKKANEDACLDTVLVNHLESVAQRVLVHNGRDANFYPALDRGGIAKDDNRTVHVVLYGLTEVAYAMATVSAQLCHFPNFVNDDLTENLERRTKITVIAPDINTNLTSFIQPLRPLLNISKCTLVDQSKKVRMDNNNDEDYIDIEWEFVNGNIADDWVRDLLLEYYKDSVEERKTYLTLVLCQIEADKNIASALFLPRSFHDIRMKDDLVDFENTIPILVFQPESEEMIKTANGQVPMFKNILSFGSIKESYDPSIKQRIKEGKRINFIYCTEGRYDAMPAAEKLDHLWRDLSYSKQLSNIYSAMHIGCKLRSVGNRTLTEEDIRILSAVEHNRWNVEKLLAGYEALPKEKRIDRYEKKALGEAVEDLETKHQHDCIAPYNELSERIRRYDEIIVRNMNYIIMD